MTFSDSLVDPGLRTAWAGGEVGHLGEGGQRCDDDDGGDAGDVVAPTTAALVGVDLLTGLVPPESLPCLTRLPVGVPARCHVDPRCRGTLVPVDSLKHPTGRLPPGDRAP